MVNRDELQETGRGVFIIPSLNSIASIRPKEALVPSIERSARDGALRLLLSFSVKHNAWCGVETRVLGEDLAHSREVNEANNIKEELRAMLSVGLLDTTDQFKNKWLRWLNLLDGNQVICPTSKLVENIASRIKRDQFRTKLNVRVKTSFPAS